MPESHAPQVRQANITIVLLKNDVYGILGIELGRVREGDANAKMNSLLQLDNPTLDWVQIAQGHGVPATRATTAEQFQQQFEAALAIRGPRLIEAQVVQNLGPAIEMIRKSMGF